MQAAITEIGRLRASRSERVSGGRPSSVFELQHYIDTTLSPEQRDRLNTIYRITTEERPMAFASPDAAGFVGKILGYKEGEFPTRQVALGVKNIALRTQTQFNPDRAKRSFETTIKGDSIDDLEKKNPRERCTFEVAGAMTPIEPHITAPIQLADVFPNAAAYVAHHSMATVVEAHHPSELSESAMVRLVGGSNEWMVGMLDPQTNRGYDPELKYPFWGMNLYGRAASSIHHPHLQFGLTREPFEHTEDLRQKMSGYKWLQGGKSYHENMIEIADDLGIAFGIGNTVVMADMTPEKEKGMYLVQNTDDRLPTPDFAKALFSVMDWMRTDVAAPSQNVFIWAPPLDSGSEGWDKFPVFAQVVDRGDISRTGSDIGFMELYAKTPVVASDPFKVAASYEAYLKRNGR